MRVFVICAIVVAIVGCGGDPIEAAENCSELSRVAEDAVAAAADDQDRLEEIADAVERKAIAMGEDAIARGAEVEAALCGEAAIETGAAAVEEVFTSVGEALEDDD